MDKQIKSEFYNVNMSIRIAFIVMFLLGFIASYAFLTVAKKHDKLLERIKKFEAEL